MAISGQGHALHSVPDEPGHLVDDLSLDGRGQVRRSAEQDQGRHAIPVLARLPVVLVEQRRDIGLGKRPRFSKRVSRQGCGREETIVYEKSRTPITNSSMANTISGRVFGVRSPVPI